MMTLHKKQNAEKFLRDMEQGIYGVSVSTSSEALERMVSSPRTVRLLKQDENGESPRTKLYKVPSHHYLQPLLDLPLIPFLGNCNLDYRVGGFDAGPRYRSIYQETILSM